MRIFTMLTLSLLLGACTASQNGNYTQTVSSWRGSNASDLLNALLRLICLCALSAFLTQTALGNTLDDSPVDNKSTYHLSDSVDLISKSDVQYDKPRVVIRLAYPKLANSFGSNMNTDNIDDPMKTDTTNNVDPSNNVVDTFNTEITRIINEEIEHFKQKIAESGNTAGESKPRNRLAIDYSSAIVNLETQPIISIRFIVQGYVAGLKQPYRRYRTLNFDMEAGSVMQLSDLFKPDSAYLAVIAAYVSKELAKDTHGKVAVNEDNNIPPDLLVNWNININGLRFTFDEASIAPAALGSLTVLIPYSKLSAFINKDSALGRCLEHRKSCMRDHLLTGAFIDEAANTRHRRFDPVLG